MPGLLSVRSLASPAKPVFDLGLSMLKASKKPFQGRRLTAKEWLAAVDC